MRYKIVALLVCILFIASVGAGAKSISFSSEKKQQSMIDDPVPTWNIGDAWIYTINDFSVDYESGNLRVILEGRIDDFKLKVRELSGSDYIVDITGKLTATLLDLYLPYSESVLHLSGTINSALSRISGTVIFTQSDLEVKDFNAEIRAIAMIKIDPLPFTMPIPIKVSADALLSTILPVFDFPLYDHKFWNLPAVDIDTDIVVGGMFGILNYPLTMHSSYPWIPLAFHCKPKTSVTVAAGTFDAYEISSLMFSLFEYYYAPEVGFLVKIDANMPNGEIHGELKSTTCSYN